jgi:hypothetical protein
VPTPTDHESDLIDERILARALILRAFFCAFYLVPNHTRGALGDELNEKNDRVYNFNSQTCGGVPKTLEWHDDALWLIDQTALPGELCWIRCTTYQRVAEAIKTLEVRGAPAIGVAAAYGVVLAALRSAAANPEGMLQAVTEAVGILAATRPTAVNLFWGLQRVKKVAEQHANSVDEIKMAL